MSGKDQGIGWPSAIVACMLVLLVAGITIAAIIKYSVEDALKIWTSLSAVVGVLTGAVVTYFFTRETVQAEKAEAARARERADAERVRAEESLRALTSVAGHVDKDDWIDVVTQYPAVQRALAGN